MSEPEEKDSGLPGEIPPVVYASPVKRVWAWVGVAYMVIIVILFTFYMANARFINGIGPLMLIPALAGMAATAVVRYRTGSAKGGLPVCITFVAVCCAVAVLNLVVGIPALLANFGG